MSNLTTFKLECNGDMRRTQLNASVTAVKEAAEKLFSVSSAILTYVDEDGDKITIGSDRELQEAIAHQKQLGKAATKISISATSSAKAAEEPKASKESNGSPQQGLPDPLLQFVTQMAGVPNQLFQLLKTDPQVRQTAEQFQVDLDAQDSLQSLFTSLGENNQVQSFLEEQFQELAKQCQCNNAESEKESKESEESEKESKESNDEDQPQPRVFRKGKFHRHGRGPHGAHHQRGPHPPCPPRGFFNNGPVNHCAVCDSCQNRIVGTRFKCLDCPDFDLCQECFPNKDQEHDTEHEFFRMHRKGPGAQRRLLHALQQRKAAKDAQQKEEKAIEVSQHVTLEPGSSLFSDSNFTKVFVVKNVSDKAWPAYSRAQFVEGHRFGADYRVLVNTQPVAPGESVHVVIDGIAPTSVGNARGVWSMRTREGHVIPGDDLVIDVNIAQPL